MTDDTIEAVRFQAPHDVDRIAKAAIQQAKDRGDEDKASFLRRFYRSYLSDPHAF